MTRTTDAGGWLVTCFCIFAAGCTSLPTRTPLSASGPLLSDPAIIRQVVPNTQASLNLEPGDVLIALGGTPVASIDEVLKRIEEAQLSSFDVKRQDGTRRTLPLSVLIDTSTKSLNALFIAPEDSFTINTKSLTGLDVRAGYFAAGRMIGSVAVSKWHVHSGTTGTGNLFLGTPRLL